jgi:hypothetical protein
MSGPPLRPIDWRHGKGLDIFQTEVVEEKYNRFARPPRGGRNQTIETKKSGGIRDF